MGVFVAFTKVCAGIVLVPLLAAPVIPAGAAQVHAMEADPVLEERFTAVDWLPVQMP